ncbi:MAG: CHAP domain-containing protein, partial [Candidatus Jordarchaeaceae archaeon]
NQLKTQQEKLENFESSRKILTFVLRHYHEFSKITDSRQIQEPETKLWLPKLSPQPAWRNQKGYSWKLRGALNRLGIFFHTHQLIPGPDGRKIIHFVLPDKIVRFITFGKIQSFSTLKKIAYQKIAKPFLIWLGKTALGKAIKIGAKKLLSWTLRKLGLLAIPEPVVSKVLLITSFLKDIGSLVKRWVKKILEKPEIAIIGGIGLISLPILVPMLPILKLGLTVAGIISTGIGFLSKAGAFLTGIVGKIGGFLSSAASTVGGFLSSLTTISLPSILPTIAVGGGVSTVAIATIITVITTGSTFIKEGVGEKRPIHMGTLLTPRSPDKAKHLAEIVIWTLNNCGITSVNKKTWSKTENCLSKSALPNKEIIIDRFYYSVFKVGPGLQCVGFVRGVTAALGKELEGGRQAAKDYLDPPPPPGYSLNTNISDVQIGDIVIMRGNTYGHMGIVVDIKDNLIWIAQSWGTEDGLLEIREINQNHFDGFLRSK